MGADRFIGRRFATDHRLFPQNPLNDSLSVIVPCFNEANTLLRYTDELIPTLAVLGPDVEVILVDDGSTDETATCIKKLEAQDPRIKGVFLSPNRGLGAALRAGFTAARGRWIVTLDADLTFAPGDIASLLNTARRENAALVAGSPFLRSDDMSSVSWSRRLPSLMLNALYRGIFGMGLTAYTPIFRLYDARSLKSLTLAAEGFDINAEIAARALLAGWKTAEVPARLLTRANDASKLRRWRELRRHVLLILRLLAGR